MILRVIDYSSAAYYGSEDDHPKKRGPKTVISDEALKHEIKQAMDSIPFHGTGYKKIHSRTNRILKGKGQSVGKNRVFRLMREENMLNRALEERGAVAPMMVRL
jgi:hypothetical protein